MSDPSQTPPPKPKPGSLRDRIAAFEKPNAASAAAPPNRPPVRPKPGNISWKPTPPSPTSTPAPAPDNEEQKRGGMSASDAKESIGRGGSLKERMAALQGKGAFGGGPPAGPPPVGPKPVKRPPLVVSPPPVDEEESETALAEPKPKKDEQHEDSQNTAKEEDDVAGEGATAPKEEQEEPAEEEQDEAAKERERRAAIAARMARLGGARVGMAPPPVFGKKPEVKPKPKEVSEPKDEPKEEVQDATTPASEEKVPEPVLVCRDSAAEEAIATHVEGSVSPTEIKQDSRAEILPIKTDEETTSKDSIAAASQSSVSTATSPPESRPSYDSSTSQSSIPTSRSPPTSMPLPAAPRRAGPPRKRSAKNIKAQAAKQDLSAEVPPVPSEAHTEPIEAPTPASPKEEGRSDDPIQEPEPAVPAEEATVESEDKLIPVVHTTADTSGSHVALDSLVETAKDEEPVHEPPTSPEEVPHTKGQESEPKEPTASIPEAPPKHEAVEEAPVSSPAAPEHHTPDPEGYESDTEISRSDAHPTNIVTSAVEDPVDDDVPSSVHGDPIAAEQPSLVSVDTEKSPSPSPDPEPEIPAATDESQVGPHVAGELQEPQLETQEEAEEDEAARRMRIAERLAKMGGRNPFGGSPFGAPATTPVRKVSVDKPQATASTSTHEEPSTVEQDTHDHDNHPASGVIAESAVASESHEVEDMRPRVSSVVEEPGDEDVPISEASIEEEHEETRPEHKSSSELPILVSKEHSEPPSPLKDTLLAEDTDEMAPPRITRAIPPPPPQLPEEDRSTSPTPPESKRASIRRSLPPPPPESTSLVAGGTHDADELDSKESHTPEHINTSPSPLSSLSKNEQRGEEAMPTDTSDARSPTLAASESSRRSIPPVPRTSSPSSPRRATSPPARVPPVPSPRPRSPQVDTVLSSTTVRRSIPPPPRRTPSTTEDTVAFVPTRKSSQLSHEPTVTKRSSSPAVPEVRDSLAKSMPDPLTTSGPDDEVPIANRDSIEEQEILEDSEPDPIDPSFYSPPRSPVVTPRNQTSFASRSREASSSDATATTDDSEQARRRTIAERMAKLGGIKFGAPPPIPRKPPVVSPTSADESLDEGGDVTEVVSEEPQEMESEEAERARRQAISARLAGMGGMRFGMLPQIPTPAHPRARSDDSARTAEAPSPPPHAPSQPESATSDGDQESEEGIKVEAGSEMSMEEVTAEDATEEPEELPPPVPSRSKRQSSGEVAPSLPPGRRPPVPASALPNRPPVPPTASEHYSASGRNVSGGSAPQPNDFVVVENLAEEEEAPPPPPPRAPRPPRSIPPPPPPPPQQASSSISPTRDMTNSQWELPDIPTGSLDLGGGGLGLDASFTSEDSTTYPPASSSPPAVRIAHQTDPVPTPAPAAPPKELSADELLQLWGVVGTAVHSAASSLFDKSKKTLIGDGTSHGFIMATLAQVPQASKATYGHLVYSQNAHAVLRRSSNIMPGDIIQLTEAKLKGHKGLQSYNQTVGTTQEPVVAIVSEFEAKRSKVKVFQANRHVGAQTVESASYRLEDLKSGSIKVFRVASV